MSLSTFTKTFFRFSGQNLKLSTQLGDLYKEYFKLTEEQTCI